MPDVLNYLNIREKGGYSTGKSQSIKQASNQSQSINNKITLTIQHTILELVDVFESDAATKPCCRALLFTGTIENEFFRGPHDDGLLPIARIIASAVGPSGSNAEYLLKLAQALRELDVVDAHVFDLERLVLELKSVVVS